MLGLLVLLGEGDLERDLSLLPFLLGDGGLREDRLLDGGGERALRRTEGLDSLDVLLLRKLRLYGPFSGGPN